MPVSQNFGSDQIKTEARAVSFDAISSREPAFTSPENALEIAVGDRRVNHGAQLAPERIGTRGQHLGHENGDQLFGGIDPERGGGSAAPGIFAGAATTSFWVDPAEE